MWDMVSKNVTQNIARLRLKRYLSVMANTKVRKNILGFKKIHWKISVKNHGVDVDSVLKFHYNKTYNAKSKTRLGRAVLWGCL